MLDWLREKRQTPVAIERFWRQVLVSAINEELDRMAAAHGFQVFWQAFLANADSYEMGVPAVPLGEVYDEHAWKRLGACHASAHSGRIGGCSGCVTLAGGAVRKVISRSYVWRRNDWGRWRLG
jgi:hypothetical protein